MSRFFFFKNAEHPFLRTVLQLRLANSFNYFIVSSNDTFDRKPWGFLKEVVDTLGLLKARFSLEYMFNVTRKQLSRAIIDSIFPVPLYRSRFFIDVCTAINQVIFLQSTYFNAAGKDLAPKQGNICSMVCKLQVM